jgi:hypothetical protein
MATPTPAKSKQFSDPPPLPPAPGEDLQHLVGDEAANLLGTLTGITEPSPYTTQHAIDTASSAIWKRVPDAAKNAAAKRIAAAADRSLVGWKTLAKAQHSWAQPTASERGAALTKKWGGTVKPTFAAEVIEVAIADLCKRAMS